MTNTDPNIDMEAIVNLSNFVKQYHTKINNLSNLLDQDQSLTFPNIKAGNQICVGNTCMNNDYFKRLKENTYDKGDVDRMISDLENKKQDSGPYVKRNVPYRLYSDRNLSVFMDSTGWQSVRGTGNDNSWGPGFTFRITQQDKK